MLESLRVNSCANRSVRWAAVAVVFAITFGPGRAEAVPIPLGDDASASIPIGFAFPICGGSYTDVNVISNGWLGFGAADTDWSPSAVEFTTTYAYPKIAPLWQDLDPSSGGSVDYFPGAGMIEIRWTGVPNYSLATLNSFSVFLFSDGTFRFEYVSIDQDHWLGDPTMVGWSCGTGDPGGTDLSLQPEPIGAPASIAIYEAFSPSSFDLTFTPDPVEFCDTSYSQCSDIDGDGFTPLAGDCDDFNPLVNPAAPEICDGLDNDCDPASADGTDEPWLGTGCDGPDSDLCQEGTFSCAGGTQTCSDLTGDDLDLCDTLDNDCNPATIDGSAEAWFGSACDGLDSDLCDEGAFVCTAGLQTCDDVTGNTLDVCDTLDNDCNPATIDGFDEAWFGNACDGPDSDLCNEGVFLCAGGAMLCDDLTGDDLDPCDGADNDCNAATPDGFDEVWFGAACDGADLDLCAEGMFICTGAAQTCDDATGDTPDLCDALDNDCNPATLDGSDEVWLGNACDGADSDLCDEGTFVCAGGSMLCNDATGGDLDLCDGADNDCNVATPDGADEAWFGTACDGADLDLCAEGTFICTGAAQTCDDATGDTPDLCDGADDDCDPSTADGTGEAWFGTACDGSDADLCDEGTLVCAGGAQLCDDTTGTNLEICDGLDNDCNGFADDGVPDTDGDNISDMCDPDDDGDGIPDVVDNCPLDPMPDQTDTDGDGLGNPCDPDDDGDGVLDSADNCPLTMSTDQTDTDGDGLGNPCDPDDDDDGVLDATDNCPLVANPMQEDLNGNGVGDACEVISDLDGDGVTDSIDNCPNTPNPAQIDTDLDGNGDLCDPDDDGDGELDAADNCPLVANAGQEDVDGDGVGDVCDDDLDGDMVENSVDNCPYDANAGQEDADGDGEGDVCDPDDDDDGIEDDVDNCPGTVSPDTSDPDEDGLGNPCDDDDDGDMVLDTEDNCPLTPNAGQVDTDTDDAGDACDPDDDDDDLLDGDDNCPLVPNPDQADIDGDGIGDACSGAEIVFSGSGCSCRIAGVRNEARRPPAAGSSGPMLLSLLLMAWVTLRRRRGS